MKTTDLLEAFAKGVSAAVGSFFGAVFLWAMIEATTQAHLQPAVARGLALGVLVGLSLGVGIIVATRVAQRNTATPSAAAPQVAKAAEIALAQLRAANPALARNADMAAESERKRQAQLAADAAAAVTETVTVVLRRQIPPRFGEAPRSWLGGLPMLPDGVAWPRSVSSEYPDRGERPLHFVAQICCADLPAELWAGLGPRQGWLLLFIDPNQGYPEDADAFRILHTNALGTERPPPDDLGPVHDGMYAAWDFGHCGGPDQVPRVWRRWPVDLVAMPNEAVPEGRGMRVAPPDLAERLYEGAPVAGPNARLAPPAPFTRRGAVYALNSALDRFRDPVVPAPLPEGLLAGLEIPGCLDQMRTYVEAQRDQLRQRLQEQHAESGVSPVPGAPAVALQREVDRRDELLAFLSTHTSPAALLRAFEDAQLQLFTWRKGVRARLMRLRDATQTGDPEAAIPPEAWAALQTEAAGEPYRGIGFQLWNIRAKNPGDTTPPVGLIHQEQNLALEPGHGMIELMAEYYTDPARQQLIPAPLVADFEAFWRRLRSNRPHRIGGYHDGVQSDATIGPTAQLLLFQVASDEAMQWCWGDVGAYYAFIRPADLKRGDFAQASLSLECH
jgi:hypothetical protein